MIRFAPIVVAWLLAACSTMRPNQIISLEDNVVRAGATISELEIGQLDDESNDEELEDILITIEELLQNPINANRAHFDDFMRIPAMRPSYARAILRQRDKLGRFSSKSQLQSVPGVPHSVMQRISAYLTLGSAAEIVRNTIFEPEFWTAGLRFESLTRIRGTLEMPDGYRVDMPNKDRVYPGPPIERYQRISARSRHFTAGVLWRSAPGATGFTSHPIFQASHMGLTGLPIFDNAVIGKYKVSYGMGLSMNGGRAPRRGFDMRTPRASATTISPYTGSSYNQGHSGFAASTRGTITMTFWMSNRKFTGTSADSSGVRWSVSEPQFRTPSEIERRDNFSIQMTGVRGSVGTGKYKIGIAAWTASASESITPTPTLYPDIGLQGKRFGVLSADVDARYRSGSISAEMAMDAQGGKAAILAVENTIGVGIDVISITRYFDANYRSPFGSTFSNWSGRPSNEVGWLVSLSIQPNRRTRYSLYNDLYSSVLPRGSDFMPASGNELGVKLNHSLGESEIQMLFRSRIRDEEANYVDIYGRSYRQQSTASRSTTRIDFITSTTPRTTWVTRAEWVWATREASNTDSGHLIHQDLSWWISSKTRLQARVTIFNSSSYTARLYAWEPDVGLASAMPSFQGQGSRSYLMATYKPKSNMEGRIKIARTQMPFEYSMGSGNDRIQDNKRTQLHTSLLIRV